VNYKETWGLDLLLDLLDAPHTILDYNFSIAIASSHSLPAVHYTSTDSSRSAVPEPVLWYRLTTADILLSGFPNYL
jgi:hypothetical protein